MTDTFHTHSPKDSTIWQDIDPIIWRNAIYSSSHTSMGQLFTSQVTLFKHLHSSLRLTYSHCALIEVGFGTAELFSQMMGVYDLMVGVQISQNMIDCAFHLHPQLSHKQVHLIAGNATQLNSLLKPTFPPGHLFWDRQTVRVACLCMNTFGILPVDVRDKCLNEMFSCVGKGGMVIVGCWHKDSLDVGYRQFYSKHPKLCGECRESDFNFETGDFKSSTTEYSSHWWSKDEMEKILKSNFPFEPSKLNINFQILGIGIFAICDISK